ncbi:MAG: TetR/AcrR family transcriptional regulator, partial [Chitinophagaceae bacterium]
MIKETKGVITRKYILDRSREIFNTKGINLTLDSIARELNITKGRITNHFPAKDNLFLAIVADYEDQFQLVLKKYQNQFESLELQSVIFILSKI